MLGEFLVASVQYGFIPRVGCHCRLAVVRNQQPWNAAEGRKGVDMAQEPTLQLHVAAGFRIGVPAAGKTGDEDIRRFRFAGSGIGNV